MKASTERLYKLLWTIENEYGDIIAKEDRFAINFIVINRIEEIKKEEQSLATCHTIDEETYKSL